MKTDELIEALAAGLEPVRPGELRRDFVLTATLAAGAAILGAALLLGVRHSIIEALGQISFWLRTGYTLGLALAGGWLLTRIGRPGGYGRTPLLVLVGLLAAVGLFAAIEQLTLPHDMGAMALHGHSPSACMTNILMLTLLSAPLIFWRARRFAPTRPAMAGAAAGLLAGALAATAYGLCCSEQTASFVAAWYSLAILMTTAAGALIGRYLLRW